MSKEVKNIGNLFELLNFNPRKWILFHSNQNL